MARSSLESVNRVDCLNQLGEKHKLFGQSNTVYEFQSVIRALQRFIEVSNFVRTSEDENIYLIVQAMSSWTSYKPIEFSTQSSSMMHTLGFVKLLDYIPTKRKRAKIRREVRKENAARST